MTLALGSLTESDLFSVKMKPDILERSILQIIIITQQLADWLLVICWQANTIRLLVSYFLSSCEWMSGLSVLEVGRHHLSSVCFLSIVSFFPTQVQGHTV